MDVGHGGIRVTSAGSSGIHTVYHPWLTGGGGNRPGTEVTSRTPSAPSTRRSCERTQSASTLRHAPVPHALRGFTAARPPLVEGDGMVDRLLSLQSMWSLPFCPRS